MPNNQGLNFFYKKLELPTNDWKILYDFTSGLSGVVPSLSGADPNFSGIVPIGNSTGNFSGQILNISNSHRLSAPAWTTMLVFEKTDKQDGILFSNYHEGAVKEGYVIGVNSANRLYVETYNENGPIIYEGDFDLGSKNAVSISKNYNSLELSYFDFNKKETHSTNFSVSDKSFLNSQGWTIGGAENTPSYFSGHPFHGYIDKFLYITGTVFPYEVDALFSGLTIIKQPEYYYTVVSEACSYSNVGLTGSVSGVVVDSLNQLSYCVQTGYLMNKTGSLTSTTSGTTTNGFATVSGNITGFIQSGTPYFNVTGVPYSGLAEKVLASGLRVFQADLPSGVNGTYIPFPTGFVQAPIVFVEINDRNTLLANYVSGVSSTGFSLWFSNEIGTGYSANVMAILPQDNINLKVGSKNLQDFSNQQFILFDSPFAAAPSVVGQLQNDSDDDLLGHKLSGISQSGFYVLLSEATTSTNYKFNYIASDLGVDSLLQIKRTDLTSGVNSQFISFDTAFASAPIVFGDLYAENTTQSLAHQISGVTTSGFNLVLSNDLNSTGYKFDSIAWSGQRTGVGYTASSEAVLMEIGRVSDACQNLYGVSGYGLATVYTPYELGITRSGNFSGTSYTYSSGISITSVPVNVSVSYSLNLGNSENATFVHQTYYSNNGNNFVTSNTSLQYFNTGIQSTPFYIFKNCNQLLGRVLEDYQYDTGYIDSFGMEGITYINHINSSDVSELKIFPHSHNKLNINNEVQVDRTSNRYILDSPQTLNNINLYENGVALLGSGYSITGNAYNSGIQFDADYIVSGSNVFTSNVPDAADIVILDKIFGTRQSTNFSGSGLIPNLSILNKGLYLNGVKLLSGVDYTTSGTTATIINTGLSGITGKLLTLPYDSETYLTYTGMFSEQKTEKFARGTSMLWANGVRQRIGTDYVEISKASLLEGDRIYPTGSSILENSQDFWENIG